MRKVKVWFAGLVFLTIASVPVLAENNNARPANDNPPAATGEKAGTAPVTPPASSTMARKSIPSINAVNVSGLLDALLKKGVLTLSEANSIRNAIPDAGLHLLIDTLVRKGVLDAADLAATATVAPTVAPSAVSAPKKQAPVPQPEAAELKPATTSVNPAIVPVRALGLDPPSQAA